MRRKRGFTLIELIMIIVILGILAAVAIPRYVNLSASAKQSACQGALGGLRSAIAIWYGNSAATGTAAFPALTDFTVTGVGGVMANASMPVNPYNNSTGITTAATGSTVAGAFGWAYDTASGKIWGNTSDSSTF